MQKLAWLGRMGVPVCLVGVGILAACSSASTDLGDGSSGGTTKDKDSGTFVREGSTYDSMVSPESGLGTMLFRPDHVYTGTDGTHTFKVPVAVYDADSDLTVTSSDASGLTLTPTTLTNPVNSDGITDNGKYYMITALKAGVYTLTATSKGQTTTASLTISDYAASRYGAGDARYNNGVTTMTSDRACTNCHVNGLAIDHSPAALATATDQDVGVIFTTGVLSGPGGPSVIKIPNEPATQHKWTGAMSGGDYPPLTEAERDGLVTYLRAINPKGFQ